MVMAWRVTGHAPILPDRRLRHRLLRRRLKVPGEGAAG
jgi:hypothetical protein